MMLEVSYVIVNQKAKCRRLAPAYHAAVVSLVFRNMKYDVKHVTVKPGPELDEIPPGLGLVPLRFHPLGLGIPRK